MPNTVPEKFIKSTIYVVLGVVLIGFIAVQPYNLYCRIKKSCKQITIFSLTEPKVGKRELTFKFISKVPKELQKKIKFEPEQNEIVILNGKHIFNSYKIKNLTNKNITISAKFYGMPEGFEEYMERIECPCMQHLPIDAQGEGSMPVNLRINPRIEDDLRFRDMKEVTIEYTVTLE